MAIFAKKRICLATGGSGGHVFPALALKEELKSDELEFLFMGGGLFENRFLKGEEKVIGVSAASLSSLRNPFKFIWQMGRGIWQSYRALRRYQPDLIIAFGSYHTFPVLVAARLLNLSYVLHEANAIPGKVNRLFARGALRIGVFFAECAPLLKGRVCEVDNPIRHIFKKERKTSEARLELGLSPDRLTFVIFGGSQGASKINTLFAQAAKEHLVKEELRFQIVHVTGSAEMKEQLEKEYAAAAIPAYVADFMDDMSLALQAADLVICRAGASTLAELLALEVPALLIPYPHSADSHQERNAAFIVRKNLGWQLSEEGLTAEKLAEFILPLVEGAQAPLLEKRSRLRQHGQAMPEKFSSLILEVLGFKR
ncbi:MAG: UDP-N-acetylglucosamine--N-acetylmuramyl-(pentapeptide) pyrophosphoryl-undecaprenol [Chlamydiales bacterium]|jgi:UDP-N-acetylglucosamine--N-acetylmuramyl-(pentapeptide) pyrophosphoryl-undecaprenol N-acetylglucosamine transferase|nr:UDP-N-acetylglucosamine--N-acetylmuramyl-(pentapeptide) pyrophosphoryl-undecaprenol [Chlamydiales bacterium]